MDMFKLDEIKEEYQRQTIVPMDLAFMVLPTKRSRMTAKKFRQVLRRAKYPKRGWRGRAAQIIGVSIRTITNYQQKRAKRSYK